MKLCKYNRTSADLIMKTSVSFHDSGGFGLVDRIITHSKQNERVFDYGFSNEYHRRVAVIHH